MPVYANRVWVATATTGTGSLTLGAAEPGYITFAQGNIPNNTNVTYTIVDGNNFEVGRGTYLTSGPTLTRDIVLITLSSGSTSTSKLSLSGAASVFVTEVAEDTMASGRVEQARLGAFT